MSTTEVRSNQLLKFPAQKEIALTPPLWLALGVLSYNHALLAKAPLRILAPAELADNLSEARTQALEQGRAALADTSTLAPSALIAAVRIAKALLEPLQITVTLLGNQHTRRYMLLEFHGEVSTEQQPPPLPTHEFPST
jgi:hypothetical protein